MWFVYVYNIAGGTLLGPYESKTLAVENVKIECGEDGAFDYGGVINLPIEMIVEN